jgi:hypothetical protein
MEHAGDGRELRRDQRGACRRGRARQPILLVILSFIGRNCLLTILQRQLELVRIKLLRAPAKLCALQLVKQMPQMVNLRQGLVAFRNRGRRPYMA